jgi:hypothetical protein
MAKEVARSRPRRDREREGTKEFHLSFFTFFTQKMEITIAGE